MKHSSFHRFAALLTLAVCCFISAFASPTSQKVTVRFDESMFKIDGTDNVIKNIQYLKGASSMPADTCLPALPSIPVIVSGPAGSTCDFTYRVVEKHLIFEDVDLIAAPRVVSSVEMRKMSAPAAPRLFKLKAATYPTEAVQYRTRSPWADATDFHFACTPFVYDAASRSLYLIDEIELTINYSDAPAAKLSAATARALTPRPSFLPSTFGNLIPRDSLFRDTTHFGPFIPIQPTDPLLASQNEYVIITSEELKPAFEKLAKWKQIKGVDPLIQTVEYIDKNISGSDLPAKIKNYLRSVKVVGGSLANAHSPIKYVLLGGSSSIVPPRYCAGPQKDNADKKIPTDLYFACLNDEYDWDMNENGIYGEKDDEISMAPSFAVTRAPVETLEEAEIFVDKVIKYEHFPKWNQKMLFAGTEMGNNVKDFTTYDRAFRLTKRIESVKDDQYHDPDAIPQNTYFLYDKKNSFGYNNPTFTAQNLTNVFSKGYNIIDIMTHGYTDLMELKMEGNTESFTPFMASNLTSNYYSMVVSMVSCNSSAFDKFQCIGKGFITGADNGVVAYIGPSRSGYFADDPKNIGDPSLDYEYHFYDALFDSEQDKNFGSVISFAKYDYMGESTSFDEYRWLQYSLNPFGDPEMPIFTERPKTFVDVHAEISSNSVHIWTNEPGSRICVTGIGSDNTFVRRLGTDDLTANSLPEKFSICVTKQGFRPWHYAYQRLEDGTYQELNVGSIKQLFDENMGLIEPSTGKIVEIKYGSNSNTLVITTSVSPKDSAELYITNLTGRYNDLQEVAPGYYTKTVDISKVEKGDFLFFSLYVNGKLVDSKTLMTR